MSRIPAIPAKAPSRKIIYSGKLATPAKAPKGLLSGFDFVECFALLMDHYGIDPMDKDAWAVLAMALAIDHVPAFSVSDAPPVGRPKINEPNSLASVLLRVEEIEGGNPPLSESKACKQAWKELKRSNPNSRYGKGKFRTLRNDVKRAKLAKKERYKQLRVAALMGKGRFGRFFGLGA